MFYYVQLGQTTAVDGNKIMIYGILLHAFMPSYYDFTVFGYFGLFLQCEIRAGFTPCIYIYIIYVWYMYIFTLNKEQREQSQIKSEA